jgi:hypothetical protein
MWRLQTEKEEDLLFILKGKGFRINAHAYIRKMLP